MRFEYDQSQDITLILTNEEQEKLFQGPTKNFSDIHISSQTIDKKTKNHYILLKGLGLDLQTYLFLGYSSDKEHIFDNAHKIENIGRMIIPAGENSGEPWLINLSQEGIEYLRKGWLAGQRYNGSSKLFIKGELI